MELLSQSPLPGVSIETVLAGFSAAMTSYFWLVKARREKPCLEFHQLGAFNAHLRTRPGKIGTPEDPDKKKQKSLVVAQTMPTGVLVANHSTRQNSIVKYEGFLKIGNQEIVGTWMYADDDLPPWNISPESSIAMRVGCWFDVPDGYEIPEDLQFEIEFVTASGKRFAHQFQRKLPE